MCLFIFTPEVTVGAFDLSSTSSILKKELLKIGKIQFAQYQLSDDVDKRWYSSIGRYGINVRETRIHHNIKYYKHLFL